MNKAKILNELKAKILSERKSNISVEIIETEDFDNEIKRHVHAEERLVKLLSGDLSQYNGLMLPYDGESTVILIKQSDEYMYTVMHEMTHAVDYYNFIQQCNDGDHSNVEHNELYYTFGFCSEFNARRKAHSHYVNDNDYDRIAQLTEILTAITELLAKIGEIDYTKFFYSLMQLLGRFAVYSTLFGLTLIKMFEEKYADKNKIILNKITELNTALVNLDFDAIDKDKLKIIDDVLKSIWYL